MRVLRVQVVETGQLFEHFRILCFKVRLEWGRFFGLEVDEVVALADVAEVEARVLLVLVVEVRAHHLGRVFGPAY